MLKNVSSWSLLNKWRLRSTLEKVLSVSLAEFESRASVPRKRCLTNVVVLNKPPKQMRLLSPKQTMLHMYCVLWFWKSTLLGRTMLRLFVSPRIRWNSNWPIYSGLGTTPKLFCLVYWYWNNKDVCNVTEHPGTETFIKLLCYNTCIWFSRHFQNVFFLSQPLLNIDYVSNLTVKVQYYF